MKYIIVLGVLLLLGFVFWRAISRDDRRMKRKQLAYQQMQAQIPVAAKDSFLRDREEGLYDKIYFGYYPQSGITDRDLIGKLNSLAGGKSNWKEDPEFHFLYQDVSYNNETYRGIHVIDRENNWFLYEPIMWRVVSQANNVATIYSCKALDLCQYSKSGDNNYAKSDLRAWLNGTFLETAFNKKQKEMIQVTSVDNSARSTNPDNDPLKFNFGENPYACENTQDKLFVVSVKEASIWNKAEEGFSRDLWYGRQSERSSYCDFKSRYYEKHENMSVFNEWTRSPNWQSDKEVCAVYGPTIAGYVYQYGDVVPVLRLKLNG